MSNQQLARITLAFIFLYHGLIPKLLFLDKTELYINQMHLDMLGIQVIEPYMISYAAGVGEVILGLILLFFPKLKWPIWLAFWSLLGLLLDMMLIVPMTLTGAFNPVTLNISGMVLAWIALKDSGKQAI
jgi:uncharacterized membrane protein YphA (DoxX/SURF4 family)